MVTEINGSKLLLENTGGAATVSCSLHSDRLKDNLLMLFSVCLCVVGANCECIGAW